jgi:hypothetical protein
MSSKVTVIIDARGRVFLVPSWGRKKLAREGLDNQRTRFNWGYHDGAMDMKRGTVRDVSHHFDRTYATGYEAGVLAQRTGTYEGTSFGAWKASGLPEGDGEGDGTLEPI